jgi:hypothetical protein
MREIAEHRCSGDYLLHQNSTPNEWFERGGYLSLKFLLSSGNIGQWTDPDWVEFILAPFFTCDAL